MSKEHEGGPAFPRPEVLDPTSGQMYEPGNAGMSLRDYFAAQAIPSLIYKSEDRDGGWCPHTVAAGCYALADAMLEARQVPR